MPLNLEPSLYPNLHSEIPNNSHSTLSSRVKKSSSRIRVILAVTLSGGVCTQRRVSICSYSAAFFLHALQREGVWIKVYDYDYDHGYNHVYGYGYDYDYGYGLNWIWMDMAMDMDRLRLWTWTWT